MKQLLRLISLLLAFLLVVFSINFIADPANIMNQTYEQKLVDILVSGKNAANVENMEDRRFLQLYSEARTQPIDTLVLGSSRTMQISPAVTGDENTLAASVTGSDLRDVINSYFLFEKQGFTPDTVVLSLEMWYLSEGNLDNRAHTEQYNQFCEQVGLQPVRTGSARLSQIKNFFSFSYFQSSVQYLVKNKLKKPLPVAIEDRWADTPVKRADGTYGYERKFRDQSQEVVDRSAADKQIADTIAVNFSGISTPLYDQLDAFVDYLQQKGITVRLLLSPVHPDYYHFMQSRPDVYEQAFESEQLYRQLAKKYNIALYGSFDPDVLGVTNADFYDAIHPKEEALMRYYDVKVEDAAQ